MLWWSHMFLMLMDFGLFQRSKLGPWGEVQNVIPLAVTRSQLVAAQELPQLVATIPSGESFGGSPTMSFGKWFLPVFVHALGFGFSKACHHMSTWTSGTSSKKLAQLDATLLGRTGGMKPRIRWLWTPGSLRCPGWMSWQLDWWNMAFRCILDLMFAGNPQGGAFSSRSTSYCLGSMTNAWGNGPSRFCDSRCREGRVLHYVARWQLRQTEKMFLLLP